MRLQSAAIFLHFTGHLTARTWELSSFHADCFSSKRDKRDSVTAILAFVQSYPQKNFLNGFPDMIHILIVV